MPKKKESSAVRRKYEAIEVDTGEALPNLRRALNEAQMGVVRGDMPVRTDRNSS